MLVDFDDMTETENRLDLLEALHDANSDFRCTVFGIPGKGSDEFWDSLPEWIELAVHGWEHPHPREAERWTYDQALAVMLSSPGRFVEGFKAPGWQISDDTYRALRDHGWWVADHWLNDGCRPEGLKAHVIHPDYRSSEHWHGHIGDVCGNGIAETFDELLARVKVAESFELISEVVA